MKYCTNCGEKVTDQTKTCPKCMRSQFKAQNNDRSYSQRHQNNSELDTPDTALCVLSFIIPLFGIIYWAIERNNYPVKAKACLKYSLIVIAIAFAIAAIYPIVMLLVALFPAVLMLMSI